jgi:hypothetical protein
MRLRLSVLVAGAPAVTVQQLAKSPRKPVIGASLLVTAPTGQYYPQKFVNLGTTYRGGQATVNGAKVGDRLTSTRIGATLAFPVGSRHGIKIAYSTGAIVRSGANFDTFSIGWQTAWVDRRMLKR